MELYPIVVFIHVVAALGLFASLGIEWAASAQVRRMADDETGTWLATLAGVPRLAGPAAGALLVTGAYMTVKAWGHQPWIGLSVLGLAASAVLAVAITGRRLRGMTRASGRVRRDQLLDPMLLLSLRMRTALAVAIVFLMTVKPGAVLSVAVLGAAVLAGVAVSVPAFSRANVR